MELKLPTPEQLETVYEADLKVSFPAAELKPLRIIQKMVEDGYYRPWCLFDGKEIVGGVLFYGWEPWLGAAGLSVCLARFRNGGVGGADAC